MVRYTGRAKTRTGSVNTNQLGLKMSGCTSRIGRTMVPMKLVPSRVDCMALSATMGYSGEEEVCVTNHLIVGAKLRDARLRREV